MNTQKANKKNVIVTGVLGQDGATMCEYLLYSVSKPIKVYGVARRSSNPNLINCKSFINHKDFEMVYGDLSDEVSISKLVQTIQPDYFINFASNSFVGCSWDMPMQVMDVNALGVLRCLEAIRKFKKDCRFYSAGSSEEFGNVDYCPQDMKHPIKPRSPYGASKAAARHLVKVYRDSYKLYAIHGILFNHEGAKRGGEFVTRKITKGVARIHSAIKNKKNFKPISLGNLSARRDWSDSEDFIRGVWLMLNQEKPKDYLLASGTARSVGDFVETAFKYAKIKGKWQDMGEEISGVYVPLPQSTKYLQDKTFKTLVEVNPKFFRPAEVNLLVGDASIARKELGWIPRISFDMMVKKMVVYDIELLNEEEAKQVPSTDKQVLKISN